MITENGFQTESSSCESDVSSVNSSESNLELEEIDRSQNSDSSCNTLNKKTFKTDKSIEFDSLNNFTSDQKKNFKSPDLAQSDKPAIFSLEFSTSNQLQTNVNDENTNQNLQFVRSGDEKSTKVKNEMDVQNQVISLNDEMRHDKRYGFDTETKNFKKDIDTLKMENEDSYIKQLDRGDNSSNNSTKRCTSANSPYKEKRRKFFLEKTENNHDLSDQAAVYSEPPSHTVKKIYFSYFEHGCDDRDEIREIK